MVPTIKKIIEIIVHIAHEVVFPFDRGQRHYNKYMAIFTTIFLFLSYALLSHETPYTKYVYAVFITLIIFFCGILFYQIIRENIDREKAA